jgi:ATP-dependent DNA ligase
VINARNADEIDAAFDELLRAKAGGFITATDPILLDRREHIVSFARKHSLPAVYFVRQFARVGGLLSYGPSISWMYRQAGAYVAQILKGANPAEMPVLQPTTFECVPPCLPTKTPHPPIGEAWLHEIKHDGFRVIARKQGKRVRLFRFPLIVESVARLRWRSCIIDGEAVAGDGQNCARDVIEVILRFQTTHASTPARHKLPSGSRTRHLLTHRGFL